MFEYLLIMSLREQPIYGRFATLQECQFVAVTIQNDENLFHLSDFSDTYRKYYHCIKVKSLKDKQ